MNHSIARSETATILANIRSALFSCTNLSGIRFLNRDGVPVTNLGEDPTMREDSIAFFVFDSTVVPAAIDCRLSAVGPLTIRFALPLPQHDRQALTISPPVAALDPDPPMTVHPAFSTIEQELEAAIAASQPATDEDSYVNPSARLAALQSKIETIMQQTPTPRRLFPSPAAPWAYTSLSPKAIPYRLTKTKTKLVIFCLVW
jgi:hypothetical protein